MESLLAFAVVVLIGLAGLLLLRTRASVRRSQTRLRAALEHMSQGIVMVDLDGRVAVMNHQAANLLGLRGPLARAGQPIDDLDRWIAGEGGFAAKPTPAGAELRRGDGRVLEHVTTILATGGEVRTYADITERSEFAENLARARDAAEAALRARADFLAVMSHEIRTPMNGIIGMAGLLLDAPADAPFGTTERHYLQVILDSGEHLLNLINDILDFSRLDAGRLELEETAFDIRSVVGAAISLLETEAATKRLDLVVGFADDVPLRAGGDPGRLRQVLLNLVGNAIKFTKTGSVRVDVALLGREAGQVRLGFKVTDTGIGILPEVVDRLFDAFTQADSSISRRFGGSGLGLTISRQLIERMGGQISVASHMGEGSVFAFDILLRARRATDAGRNVRPTSETAATTPAPVAATTIAATAPPAFRARRVLVAEDNPTNRLVVTRMLERIGHSVAAVTNGREALEAVQLTRYDVVLMDVMMPEMDGLTATGLIRALPGPEASLPIIGLTANAMRSEETACRSAGMSGFATKPITIGRLAEVIEQAFGPTWPDRLRRGESRVFDAACIDALVASAGRVATQARVARFIADHQGRIDSLRLVEDASDHAALAAGARALAMEAGALGLMRAARAGLDLAVAEPSASLDTLAVELSMGVDDLRDWRSPVAE